MVELFKEEHLLQSVVEILPKSSTDEKITSFKKSYLDSYGNYSRALEESGVTPFELSSGISNDAWDELQEEALQRKNDLAEDQLMNLIESGEPNAIIFYCSTRLKNRGYKK